MYCVKCGVKLAESEQKCPLCHTVVYHPDLPKVEPKPLYPADKLPPKKSERVAVCGMVLILFFVPVLICLSADFLYNGAFNWSDYAAGALATIYILFVLPTWFKKPNPVIFIPCDFVAVAAYLLYINIATGGDWFWGFALPLIAALCVIVSAAITLLYYLKKGRLYIIGGTMMASGGLMLLTEYLIDQTFALPFVGWSVYPLIILFLLGGALIYLGINPTAREALERKLFF